MKRPARMTILLVARPGNGKTTMMVRITDALLRRRAGLDSIFVLDLQEQWSVPLEQYVGDVEQQIYLCERDQHQVDRGGLYKLDGPIVTSLDEYETACELLAAERKALKPRLVPPRVIWRLGARPEDYGPAIREAVDQGHVMLCFSEGQHWWATHKSQWAIQEIPGREDVTLQMLLTEGRAHILNRYGERCRIHLLCDTQDLALMHWQVRNMFETVLVGPQEGQSTINTLRAHFGTDPDKLIADVRACRRHEWVVARGSMPELAPFNRGGRP